MLRSAGLGSCRVIVRCGVRAARMRLADTVRACARIEYNCEALCETRQSAWRNLCPCRRGDGDADAINYAYASYSTHTHETRSTTRQRTRNASVALCCRAAEHNRLMHKRVPHTHTQSKTYRAPSSGQISSTHQRIGFEKIIASSGESLANSVCVDACMRVCACLCAIRCAAAAFCGHKCRI